MVRLSFRNTWGFVVPPPDVRLKYEENLAMKMENNVVLFWWIMDLIGLSFIIRCGIVVIF